ncbi:MAG: hypothetical protein HC830_03585 [Bacteroidetes bacterium]|nr:hypothetical protein [Bacteroidota bacterium]
MMRGCIFILGIAWVLLSSCSDNNSRKEISGKPIKLTEPVRVNWVGHWQNEGYKEQLLFDMARRFEFENQDIVLNLKFPAEAYPGVGDNEFNLAEIQKQIPIGILSE